MVTWNDRIIIPLDAAHFNDHFMTFAFEKKVSKNSPRYTCKVRSKSIETIFFWLKLMNGKCLKIIYPTNGNNQRLV